MCFPSYYSFDSVQGKGHSGAVERIYQTFWTTLKMNWKIWTAFQYININFIPVQVRSKAKQILSMFPVVHPKTAMHGAFFYF